MRFLREERIDDAFERGRRRLVGEHGREGERPKAVGGAAEEVAARAERDREIELGNGLHMSRHQSTYTNSVKFSRAWQKSARASLGPVFLDCPSRNRSAVLRSSFVGGRLSDRRYARSTKASRSSPTSVRIRMANCFANSAYSFSFRSMSACGAVVVVNRREQVSVRSGASNAAKSG